MTHWQFLWSALGWVWWVSGLSFSFQAGVCMQVHVRDLGWEGRGMPHARGRGLALHTTAKSQNPVSTKYTCQGERTEHILFNSLLA